MCHGGTSPITTLYLDFMPINKPEEDEASYKTILLWVRLYIDTFFQCFQGLVVSMSFCFTIWG